MAAAVAAVAAVAVAVASKWQKKHQTAEKMTVKRQKRQQTAEKAANGRNAGLSVFSGARDKIELFAAV